MDQNLRKELIRIAKSRITTTDISHDFEHAARVLLNAKHIAEDESADLDILVPAALFHDIIVYPKDDPRANRAQQESGEAAGSILRGIAHFPHEKISKVIEAIESCSFSKGRLPTLLEAKIIQDADGLEATGAISIMRTFSSTGQMKRSFYNPEDPFCQSRKPDDIKYALDLFYTRLLVVADRMHTKRAKEIANRRTKFLLGFIDELKMELAGR